MPNKHHKHFSITLVVSLAVHFFVLTVLFAVPEMDEPDGYKKVRVKLGIKTKPVDSFAKAEKYASYSPETKPAEVRPVTNSPEIQPASRLGATEEKNPAIAKPMDPTSTMAIEEKQAILEKESQSPVLERVVENVSRDVVIPKISPVTAPVPVIAQKDEDTDEESTIIGNSAEADGSQAITYEQMLPLWLDKFKQYPKDAMEIHTAGVGEVFIKIDRQGKVLLSKVIKSTGYPPLDRALMKMIADADPVLPVPIDYHSDKKTFSYKIAFEFKEPKE